MSTPGKAYTKADLITADVLEDLEHTHCGLSCDGCGTRLETEADFARHFVLPDGRYLNLGECPHTPRGQSVVTENVPYYKRGGPVE